MRLRRRSSSQVAVGDDVERLHDKAEAIRCSINRGLREFRLSAEITKARVDAIYENLVEKSWTLTEKAKKDIDTFSKTEALKLETVTAGKLLEIHTRLAKLEDRAGTKQHIEHRVSSLFSELQNLSDVINTKQIDFKINEKAKYYLKSVDSLGNPRTLRQNRNSVTGTQIASLHSDEISQQNMTMSVNSLVGDRCSLSTSNNVSSDEAVFEALSSPFSVASSSFCQVTSYDPGQNDCSDQVFQTHRNMNQISVENTLDSKDTITVFDTTNGDKCFCNSYLLSCPFQEQECETKNALQRHRHLEETSWGSSLTLSSQTDVKIKCGSTDLSNEIEDCKSTVPLPSISITYEREFQACDHRGACVIPDIAIFPDHKIVLADHYHNNVQVYNTDFQLISEEKCPYPMSVCVVGDNIAAVSLRRAAAIALFRIEDTGVKRIREISVNCTVYTWNVIYKAGHLYVVCDKNNVHVLTLNGNHIRVIKTGVPIERGYIRYFDVSDDGNRLYLCEGLGLSCIDKVGNHIWRFDSLDVPVTLRSTDNHVVEDVCFTNGRLLATHWMQSKVFEISLDGTYVRDVVTTNLDSPRAMGIAGDRLVVTQFNPNIENRRKRTVKVFKISLN